MRGPTGIFWANLTPFTLQGSPRTGDGWSFAFSDGSAGTVCAAGSVAGCDGKANIRADFSVDMLVAAPKGGSSAGSAPTITTVTYGGVGPWLDEERQALVYKNTTWPRPPPPPAARAVGGAAVPAAPCKIEDFHGHRCHVGMTNLTAAAITTAAQVRKTPWL
jgi:hypothetical protein